MINKYQNINQSNDLSLSQEDIIEFKKIIKEDYGIDLTNEEAKDQAIRAITFGKLLDMCELIETIEKSENKEQNE